jgi:hypothetical protein
MKRFSLGPANQTIALLIFMAALAVPLYGQEVTTSQKAEAPEASAEQTSEVVSQRNVNSSVLCTSSDQNTLSLWERVRGEGIDAPKSPPQPSPTAGGSTKTREVRGFQSLFVQSHSSEEVSSGPQVDSAHTTTKQASSQSSQPYVFPTKGERFNRYVKSMFGPGSLAFSAFKAGIDQWQDHPEEWEQGASGYGKRYASDFGRNAIQQTVIYGLDSALGLDTGFKKSTKKGFFPRMKDALAENVTSRTRSGKRVISVPRLTGVYGSRVIQAEAWYPERYSYKDGLRRGTRSLLTGFGLNLVREFVFNW